MLAPAHFEASTADALWENVFNAIAQAPPDALQDSGKGPTKELLHAHLVLRNPRERWISTRAPALNPAFAIAEVVWMLNGRNDAAFVNYWNRALPRFQGSTDFYPGAYGHRLRRHFGLDQLSRAASAFRHFPVSRQIVLQIWDPRKDLPDRHGKAPAQDIPCNVASLLKVRHGRLEWLQIMRSNDVIRGLPYNIVQFTTLQEVMAGWIGVDVGTYHHIADSLHIYDHDLPEHGAQRRPLTTNTDQINLPQEVSERYWRTLASVLDEVRKATNGLGTLATYAEGIELPKGFKNLLRVVLADAARRSNELFLAADIMDRCTNPMLSMMWDNWIERTAS